MPSLLTNELKFNELTSFTQISGLDLKENREIFNQQIAALANAGWITEKEKNDAENNIR